MYTFEDRGGDSLTLRPEATAGIVRACITTACCTTSARRSGAWARCSATSGRRKDDTASSTRSTSRRSATRPDVTRAHHDVGAPVAAARLAGCASTSIRSARPSREGLPGAARRVFRRHEAALDETAGGASWQSAAHPRHQEPRDARDRRRRAGDHDYLDPESAAHFASLRAQLDGAGIDYVVNPRLVRGLDYYSRTVFEWVTTDWGRRTVSPAAVTTGSWRSSRCPGAGDRLGARRGADVELMRLQGRAGNDAAPHVYLALAGAAAEAVGLGLAESLRDAVPAQDRDQLRRRQLQGAAQAGRPQRREPRVILGDDEWRSRSRRLSRCAKRRVSARWPLAGSRANCPGAGGPRTRVGLNNAGAGARRQDGVLESGRSHRQRTRGTTAPLVSDNWRGSSAAWRLASRSWWLAVLAATPAAGRRADEASYLAVVESLDSKNRDAAVQQAAELQKRRPGSRTPTRPTSRSRRPRRASRVRRGSAPAARVADRSRTPSCAWSRRRASPRARRTGQARPKRWRSSTCRSRRVRRADARDRGDAFTAKGDAAQARTEYDAAIKASTPRAASTARSSS